MKLRNDKVYLWQEGVSCPPSRSSVKVENSDDHQKESDKVKVSENHEWVIEYPPPVKKRQPNPRWANRPIRIRHNSEQIEEFKAMRTPEYWQKKWMETREKRMAAPAKKKSSSQQRPAKKHEIKVKVEKVIEVIDIDD